jgi:capsular polysaccharide biosynthesis protein
MEITAYLRIIARYWWVILLTTVVSTGVAFAITETKAKSYTVNVRVLAQPASVVSNTNELINMSGQIGTREVMGTLAEAFTSADVQSNALAAAGMNATQATDYPIQANVLPASSVIEVTGTGHDPVLLANYVNATVSAGVKYGSSIYRVIDLVPMERATVPAAPTSPVPSRDIPLGAGLGLALGLLLAFATDYMRTPRRYEGEIQIRALPSNPIALNRDDRIVVNGTAPQDYLVGRQQRTGSSLPPGRPDDKYPG